MALLTVSGISKKEREDYTVKDISFVQEIHQKIAIAGETGSGKTTLLKMIAGLVQPDEGEIRFENKRVVGPFEKLLPGHPAIAYLSQHFELRNNYRVEEELESKNLLTEKEANTVYDVCRIKALLRRKTDQLSGGERQRIVLARLLTTSPKLLLLDEPFSNLDAMHKSIIKSVLQDIGEKLGITCILVSHDALDTLSWADVILVMKDGVIIQQNTPEVIYKQPVNEYCGGLFGEYNLLSTEEDKAFASMQHHLPKGKQLFLRPEDFSIRYDRVVENALSGIVKKILFWGSYYTIDVLTGQRLIRVKVNNKQFLVNDKVYLSFSPENIWRV